MQDSRRLTSGIQRPDFSKSNFFWGVGGDLELKVNLSVLNFKNFPITPSIMLNSIQTM
jgi:hypothetical protein